MDSKVIKKYILLSFIMALLVPVFTMNLTIPIELTRNVNPFQSSSNKITELLIEPKDYKNQSWEQEYKENIEPYLWGNKNQFSRILSSFTYKSFWMLYMKYFIIWFIIFLGTTISYFKISKKKNA